MRLRRSLSVSSAVAAALGAALLGLPGPASAAGRHSPFTFAVIGDTPYGDSMMQRFPSMIEQINADPSVRFVDHLGDIKSGSTVCSDEYFQQVRADFDRFTDPLVYTVGDNEWTDCHRPSNGGYNPLERLQTIRDVFFDRPGHTLGKNVGVHSQADRGVPENVSYTRAGVDFAAVDVVGSDNSLAPWTGNDAPTSEQVAEERRRTAATIDLINQTFDRAGTGHRAVVLMMQADMFDPTIDGPPSNDDFGAFRPIVQTIAKRAESFGGPVYLFNGDSHEYNVDNPLTDPTWMSFYGLGSPVTNLTRVTVDGSGNADDYLRVSVNNDHSQDVLSWERVPYTS